ncbi:MAG: hypothetical protein NTY87_00065, partial [Planctomycetia bacterium]|nr:hypothetical protein [Planctomycetia bacterium]
LEAETADPVPAVSAADLVRLDARAGEAERELAQLEAVVADVREMGGQMADPGYREKLDAMQEAVRAENALASRRVRVLREIADAQAAAARAAGKTAVTERERAEAERELEVARERLEAATRERERLVQSAIRLRDDAARTATVSTTGRAPRERDTDKIEFGVMLKYGRMYLMHDYRTGEREVNTKDFVLTPGLLNNTAEPKPNAGLDLKDRSLSAADLRRYLASHPAREWYPCLVVHPDSFQEFLTLKAVLVSLGYEYRLMPTNKGVLDGGGDGGRVQ